MNPDYSELVKMQKELFELLDEIIKKSTGKSYSELCNINEFDDIVRTKLPEKAKQFVKGLEWGYTSLEKFYEKYRKSSFTITKQVMGLKLLLGGGRFTEDHLNSIRKMLLYSDTILLPDPILPWVEIYREEEAFRDVNFLKAIFLTLQFKPLVEAKLAYPAIVVFPSWEKTLEQQDDHTKQAIPMFAANFFSQYLGTKYSSLEDVQSYILNHADEFLRRVVSSNLFIAPGEKTTKDIRQVIAAYKQYIKTWRSPEYQESIEGISDAMLIFNGIMERLVPLYHLFENSEELQSQPMFCSDVHWHYYALCSKIHDEKLTRERFLKPETVAVIQALSKRRFNWLGNVQIYDLVTLREDDANVQFRKKLAEYVSSLHESTIADLDKVANEVSRGISALLTEHQKEIAGIQSEFQRKHKKTLTSAVLSAAAYFLPTLAPLTGVVPPLILASKYFWDKIDEMGKKKACSKSLMGVLAKAAETGRDWG